MQKWLADPNRRAGQMAGMVDAQIERGQQEAKDTGDGVVRWRHAEDRETVRKYCTELVTRLEPILLDRILTDEFHAPHRFQAIVNVPYLDGTPAPVRLTGEMDIFVVGSEGYEVWDLKGTADPQYWRRVLGQLVFYDLAVLALYGRRTVMTGLIQPMCPEPVLMVDITDAMRSQLWARINRMAHDIWRKDHACKTKSTSCGYCEVRHACPRYDPANDTLGLSLRRAAKEAS